MEGEALRVLLFVGTQELYCFVSVCVFIFCVIPCERDNFESFGILSSNLTHVLVTCSKPGDLDY